MKLRFISYVRNSQEIEREKKKKKRSLVSFLFFPFFFFCFNFRLLDGNDGCCSWELAKQFMSILLRYNQRADRDRVGFAVKKEKKKKIPGLPALVHMPCMQGVMIGI